MGKKEGRPIRYRKLDLQGDYSFGQGQGNFWINVPDAVGQYVLTRLNLWQSQWFADLTQGVPWETQVLGVRTQATRDLTVQAAISQTPGVQDIADYASAVNPNTRTFAAAAVIDTIYGAATVVAPALPATVPPLPPVASGAAGAGVLALRGGAAPLTGTVMQPADLTQPGQQNITGFQVTAVDGGRY